MAHSYIRRKQFEARLLAVELTPRQPVAPKMETNTAPKGQQVSLDAMFDLMGADGFK